MSDQTRVLHVRGGVHTSNNIFETNTDVTFASVEPFAEPRLVATIQKNARNLVRGDAHQYARRTGAQVTSLDIELFIRGLATPADNTVLAVTTSLEYAWLFNSVFGQAGVCGTGATITGGVGASSTLIVGETAGFPVGNAVLFSNGTENVAREIVARSAASGAGTLTLDRDYTGAPAGVAYGSISWYLNAANSNHLHTAWDLLGDNWRRKLSGCLGNMVIPVPTGGQMLSARFGLLGTAWESATVDGASFSAQTYGSEIKALAASIFLGDDQYNLIDGEISLGLTPNPRPTPAGVNGFLGYACKEPTPSMKGKFQFGALTGELTDTLLRAIQGETTYDAAVQFGVMPGACMYSRFPALDMTIDLDKADGYDVAAFDGMACRPSAGNGAMRFHLF